MGHSTSNRMKAVASESCANASEAIEKGYRQAQEMVSENPATSVMTAFGVGLGVGVCLAMVLVEGRRRPMDYGFREKLSRFMEEHAPWNS